MVLGHRGAHRSNGQDLWIGVSRGFAIPSSFLGGGLGGPFDQDAFLEACAGADERDQVGRVHGAPE